MVVGDFDGDGVDDLVADFREEGVSVYSWGKFLALGPLGLWCLYNGTSPALKLHDKSPKGIVTADLDETGKDDVLISLPSGLFVRFNDVGDWQKLRDWPVQDFVAGGFD
jgi:hypothetical protein